MRNFDDAARTWDQDEQKVERARRVADAIVASVPDLARMDVLEFGSGTGLLGLALHDRCASLVLVDSSREMTAVAREKIAALGANATALQLDLVGAELPAIRVDLVCTLLTLHHVRDTDRILRRFHELVRPGGWLCVADLDAEDGSFHGPGFDGHDGFDRAAFVARLDDAGFRLTRLSTAFDIVKETPQGRRAFPVFLAVAQKR